MGLTAPCPCRVSRGGVPFPFSLLKPQVPPLPRLASSELRTLMVTLFSPQFKRTSAALSPPPSPALISHPWCSQLAS